MKMRTEDGYFVRKCLDGDSAAFAFLVEKYKACVFALAKSRLRNLDDAEDATQEVFIKAYKNLHKFRNWESIRTWLYVVTSNECKMRLRSQFRRPDREFIEDQNPEILENPSMDSYRNDKVNESLHEALDSLPDIYRDVLTLYYLGDMDGEDISKFLGITHATVRQRLSRARAQLKEEMIDMMAENFAQQRLQSSFTFRIVEMVKRIKIHPISTMKGLPWGLSLATGILITVLSLNPYITQLYQLGTLSSSPLPSETKVLNVGEIPVDVVKTSNVAVISSKIGKGKGGEPKQPDMKNTFFMVPKGEGGTWKQKADMPTPRMNFGACTVNGKIYAVGGYINGGNVATTMEEYDPDNDQWNRKSSMNFPRGVLAVAAVNRKIYAIGGEYAISGETADDVTSTLSIIEEYDPKTDRWTRKTDMPTGRTDLSACAVNGKIYVIGGRALTGYVSTLEVYDPKTDIWTKKADMPTARGDSGIAVVKGKIYVIGGQRALASAINPTPVLSVMEEYDPVMDKWMTKADMPTARSNVSAEVINGKIYAITGIAGEAGPKAKSVSTVEIYDPSTDTWTKGLDIPTNRSFNAIAKVNGKLYVIGGTVVNNMAAGPRMATVEEYTPEGLLSNVSSQGKMPKIWGKLKGK
jgi:RNA polymerase sigma factor (sigma-70 family)